MPLYYRKMLLVFTNDRKETLLKEMEDSSLTVIGSCTSKFNNQKATILIENGRNSSKMNETEQSELLTKITGMFFVKFTLVFYTLEMDAFKVYFSI